MSRLFCCGLSIIIALAGAIDLFGQPDWMSANAALMGKKQLNELALPGAHDAGTFPIKSTKSNGITFGGGDGPTSPDIRPLVSFLSLGSSLGAWAKTQERTSLEMLNDGIRYFDIRVCVDGKGVLMTCHGLFGASIEAILDDVRTFTEQHPREVVLLGFNHFWDRQYQIEKGKRQGEIEGLRRAKWTELADLIKSKLGGKLVSGRKFGPASKLSELWELKANNQVIALFDSDDAPDDEFFWRRREENTWVAGWDMDEFKAGTLRVLQNAQNKQYAGKFYAIRSSVTPDENGRLISLGFLSDLHPKSVSELADQTNPVVLGWIKNEWAGKYPVNLIWADFYNRADLIKLAKHLNGIKVDFRGTKIGTETKWARWKKKQEGKK
jgi:hypothetical protein